MTWQDEDVPITTDQASRLCRRITTAGAGKVQKAVPDGDECQLVFGDGASLTMWQVDISEKNAANPTGTFIRWRSIRPTRWGEPTWRGFWPDTGENSTGRKFCDNLTNG